MAVPEPEHEPRPEAVDDVRAPARDLRGIMHPYIQDPCRYRHPPGSSQQVRYLAEHVAARVRDENR
jgi:hypothetical protein